MSTATAEPTSLEAFLADLRTAPPEQALELAIKATEMAKLESDRLREESEGLTDVAIGPDGYEIKNLGGFFRLGKLYARTQMVPDAFKGKPADCAIVIQLAHRLKVDPFMLFQHIAVIHGKPGLDAQLSISLLNNSGRINGVVDYISDGTGDDYGYRAICEDSATGAKVTGPKVDWKMVKKEGWYGKKGSKWPTMPEMMFRYRSASYLIRTHYPDVTMGMPTIDELEDIQPENAKPAGKAASSLSELTAELEADASQPTPEPEAVSEVEREPEPKAEDYKNEFRDATTKTQCDDLAKLLLETATEREALAIIAARDAAKKRIGGKRGPRSNKAKEPSVLEQAIADLRDCASAQEARSLAADMRDRPEIQALSEEEMDKLTEVALEMAGDDQEQFGLTQD